MKICFLHVGFHKTATTSFQLTIQHNSDLLKHEGIILPRFRSKTKGFSSNHSGQIRSLFNKDLQHLSNNSGISEKTRNNHQLTLQGHYDSLIQLLHSNHNILISGEDISCMPQQALLKLKKKIEDHGFLIKPFALVRAPYAFITSALQQTIKGGKYQPLIGLIPRDGTAFQDSLKIPSRSNSIRTLDHIFEGSMNYIPFNTATKYPGGPVLFLLKEVLHLKHADQYELINANESKGNLSIRLKNFFNQKYSHVDKGKLRILLNTIPLDEKHQKFLLTEREFDAIKSQYLEEKENMEKLLSKDFTEEGLYFSTEISTNEVVRILSMASQKLYKFAANHN